MRILLADQGISFDGRTPRERPLGGAESAFVALSEAMASLGHEVEARAVGARNMSERGVRWRPLDAPWPEQADLYIASRTPKLLSRPVKAGALVFWLHNPAQFLAKPRYALPVALKRPKVVFLGPSHASTAPRWTPDGGRHVIPYGIERPFLDTPRAAGDPPPPRALFTSNPLRSLDKLIALWRDKIRPHAPSAELHIFSGPATYGGVKADQMAAVLAQARETARHGVVLRAPIAKAELAVELAQARALLYLGDLGETFCLAVGEAQAMGVPAVVKPVGSVGERVIHQETGFVETEDDAFCARAVEVLTDDALWSRLSANALATRPKLEWARAAREFIELAH